MFDNQHLPLSYIRYAKSLYEVNPSILLLYSLTQIKKIKQILGILGRNNVSLTPDFWPLQNDLSLLVKPIRTSTFWDHSHPHENPENIWLETEVFCGQAAGIFSSGSTRHALIGEMLVKGTGANELCHRTDFDHAWGGLWLQDAIGEYIQSALLMSSLPEGIIGADLVTIPCSKESTPIEIDECNLAQLWRSFSNIRISQIDHPFLFAEEVERVQSTLKRFYPKGSKEAWERTCFQFASAFVWGIRQRSNIKENYTLSSAFIDLNSVKVFDSDDLYFRVFLSTRKSEDISDAELLEEFGKDESQTSHLIDSDLACNLYLGLLGTLDCLSRFYSDLPDAKASIELYHDLVEQLISKMGGNVTAYRNCIPVMTKYALTYLRDGGHTKNYFFAYLENIALNLAPVFNIQDEWFKAHKHELTLTQEFIHEENICFYAGHKITEFQQGETSIDHFVLSFNQRPDRIRHQEISEDALIWLEHAKLEDPIEKSSKLHQYLLKHSRINPYKVENEKVVFNLWSLDRLEHELKNQCEFDDSHLIMHYWTTEGFSSVQGQSLKEAYNQLPETCILVFYELNFNGKLLTPLLPLKLIHK